MSGGVFRRCPVERLGSRRGCIGHGEYILALRVVAGVRNVVMMVVLGAALIFALIEHRQARAGRVHCACKRPSDC
jgi:predicted metal-binding membrane protein